MSRRTDLEEHIQACYALIRQYGDGVRLSADPKERERAQKSIAEQWALIREALDELERLGGPLSPDLVEIAAHFGPLSRSSGPDTGPAASAALTAEVLEEAPPAPAPETPPTTPLTSTAEPSRPAAALTDVPPAAAKSPPPASVEGELERCFLELDQEKKKAQEEQVKVRGLVNALANLTEAVSGLVGQETAFDDAPSLEEVLPEAQRILKQIPILWRHHVVKVVYYDRRYPGTWIRGENAAQTCRYFAKRGFLEKDAESLKEWLAEAIESVLASRSLIVFAQDIVPDTVVEVRNTTNLLRRYLDAGGRVVWWGDIPFWYQGKATGAQEEWYDDGPHAILGVTYNNYRIKWPLSSQSEGDIWDKDLPIEITLAGQEIGLGPVRKRFRYRPVPVHQIDIAYALVRQGAVSLVSALAGVTSNGLALCWKKNFNKQYPYSGFMQYFTGEFLWREDLPAFFQFAVSGWPLLFDG